MKLPGINYLTPVQPLARFDTGAHVRAAIAKGNASTAVVDAVTGIAQDIYEKDAASEYNSLWSDAQTQLSAAEMSLTENQYDEDEQGNLVSRHDTLVTDYDEVEKSIKERFLDKARNPLARQKLEASLTERGVKSKISMMATAAEWSKNESHRRSINAIETNIAAGRYDEASRSFSEAAATGSLSPKEIETIPSQILGHERYSQIGAAVSYAVSPQEFHAIRGTIGSDTMISETQRAGLNAKLDQSIEDSLVTAVRSVIEETGIKKGESFVRGINSTNFGKIGFAGEEGKYKAITRLQQVVEDYKFGLEIGKASIELNERKTCVLNGCPMDPKNKVDKQAMNEVFEENVGEEEPFSENYMQMAEHMAKVQGWVPEAVKSDIRSHMWHADPASVVASANALTKLDAVSPRSVSEFNREDIAFALTLNEYSYRGVPKIETIEKIREGIYRVPESVRGQRRDMFNSKVSKEADKQLSALVNDDDVANPWNKFSAQFPDEMLSDFRDVMRDEYIRTGDTKIAATMAYRTLRRTWGVTSRDGRLRLERNAPEAIVGDGSPQPWMDEQYSKDLTDSGINPDNIRLEYDISSPDSKRWILIDKEKGDVIIDKNGQVTMWSPDYNTSPEANRQRKKAEDTRKLAEAKRQHDLMVERSNRLYWQGRGGEPLFGPDQRDEMVKDITAAINSVNVWEFVLDDMPEWWNSWHMPHNRRWAKEFDEARKQNALD